MCFFYLMILVVSRVLGARCWERTLWLLTKYWVACWSSALPVMLPDNLEDKTCEIRMTFPEIRIWSTFFLFRSLNMDVLSVQSDAIESSAKVQCWVKFPVTWWRLPAPPQTWRSLWWSDLPSGRLQTRLLGPSLVWPAEGSAWKSSVRVNHML